MLLALVVDPPLAEFPNPGRKIRQDFQSYNFAAPVPNPGAGKS